MDWDKLKIFHAVAEAGSFTNATVNLNLSQSAISRQIQSLEQDLKVQLFERHARGLTLTQNGEYVFKTAHEVISKLKEVETSLGAKNIINRAEFDKDPRPIDKGLWDGVVDTVGGKILANAIAQTKSNGIISVCGNANSNELNTNLLPFMLRGIKVWGMDSANCSIKRRGFIWGEAKNLIDFDLLEKSVLTVSLEELIETYPKILKGEISGRVLVDLNK